MESRSPHAPLRGVRFVEPSFFSCMGMCLPFLLGYTCCQPEFAIQHKIKDFLKRGAAKHLHLEQLPGYALDLNPDEGIWNYLKRVELGNVCCCDFDHLYREIIRGKERLRHKKEIIISC